MTTAPTPKDKAEAVIDAMTRKRGRQQWRSGFRADFAVPDCIAYDTELEDISWHNDVCPSFCLLGTDHTRQDNNFVLWVNHPDPQQREMDGPRFMVSGPPGDDEHYYDGDDADEAVRILKKVGAV